MDVLLGEDGDMTLGDTLVDANATPADAALQSGLRKAVYTALSGLDVQEAKMLRMRFGIELASEMTLDQMGRQLDMTREHLRQIEASAMVKLRKSRSAGFLLPFLDAA